MAFAFRALTHPLAPVAWWAINTPEVTDMVAGAMGVQHGGRMLADPADWDDDLNDDEKKRVRMVIIASVAASLIIPIVIWVVVASIYKSKVTAKRQAFPSQVPPDCSLDNKDFKYPICACKDDCQYCLHGLCLEGVRSADTYAAVGISGFWSVCGAFFLTWALAQFISLGIQLALNSAMSDSVGTNRNRMQRNNVGNIAWYIANLLLALYLANQRQKLRARMGDQQASAKYCKDFCLWWWCGCCVSIQEARQVDEAHGYRVECCCNLIKVAPPAGGSVGAPVVMGTVLG